MNDGLTSFGRQLSFETYFFSTSFRRAAKWVFSLNEMDLKDFKYTVADGKQNKITINDGFKVDASDTKTTPYGFPDFLTKGILPINTFTFTHNDLCTCRRKIYYVR